MRDIVETALNEIGSGTGGMKYIQWFGSFGAGTPWCSIFVSWCANAAGLPTDIIPKTASTTEGMNWFRAKGLFQPKGAHLPQRGDIIYFKTGASHVGIVISSDSGKVYTIEGNTSNTVAKRNYPLNHSTITGYGTPRYPAKSLGNSGMADSAAAHKDITSIRQVYATGAAPEKRKDTLVTVGPLTNTFYELLIEHNGSIQIPVVQEEVVLKSERRSSPGELNFTVIKCNGLDFQEGDPVSFFVGGIGVFHGYVFTKKRNKDGSIQVTAFDQIRYLKNHDTIIYDNITAAELLGLFARDYLLRLGTLDAIDCKLTPTVEGDKAAIDILESALDYTLVMTGKMYVLYDDFGKLCLRDTENMALDVLVDASAAQDFDYTSSIDKDAYNTIKLAYDNKETGVRELYTAQDADTAAKWGVLQMYKTIDTAVGAEEKARVMLSLYNRRARRLTLKNVKGDIRVRGGSSIYVTLDLGDIVANGKMMVESAEHHFKENEHTMDLSMRGWEFVK